MKINWRIVLVGIIIVLFWAFIVYMLGCAPSQKEIDDEYRIVLDSANYHHTMDSLKNLDIDSLINSILADTTD